MSAVAGQNETALSTEIGLVHLVWVPVGVEPLIRFLASYREHGCGVEHELIVVFNGARNPSELEPFQALLKGVEHRSVQTPAPVPDIPAYLEATRRFRCKYYCFVNSYSLINDPEWLAKLHTHASSDNVGLVGASGSWESLYSSVADYAFRWLPRVLRPRPIAGWIRMEALRPIRARRMKPHFQPFPNPHVRSNTFMIRRDVLLRLKVGPLPTKLDAHRFESGLEGLSRQVSQCGLAMLVVGRDGVGYPPESWPQSRTFRIAKQENLLVSDNRTREYLEADHVVQALLREITWGPEWR